MVKTEGSVGGGERKREKTEGEWRTGGEEGWGSGRRY